jgi:ZIP family zinc transporter
MLDTMIKMLGMVWLAVLAMPAGAWVANQCRHYNRKLHAELVHYAAGLGGGALISAVALVLIPHGTEHYTPVGFVILFGMGACMFMALDRWITVRSGTRGQLLAMLLDFIPESIAIGATCGSGGSAPFLLAMLIAVQNLPEGFNAFHEIDSNMHRPKKVLSYFFILSILGPICASIGMFVLAEQARLLAGLMIFAAGGILYITFQDVAPKAYYRGHWAPPLGAVSGFAIGVIGQMLFS